MIVPLAYGSIPADVDQSDQKMLLGDEKSLGVLPVGQSRQLSRVLSLLLGQICFMSLVALAALFFLNNSSSNSRSSLSAEGLASMRLTKSESGHSNDESFSFSFFAAEDIPTNVFSSDSGQYVIVGDASGHLYRSEDYGSTFKRSRPFSPSEGVYSDLAGLVMTKSAKHMLASTGSYLNFVSHDYGSSWLTYGSQACSLMAASSDLGKIMCIGGTLEHKNDLYISLDSGLTWESTGQKEFWKGVSANGDFTRLLAVAYTGCGYVYHSTDEGASWRRSDSDESCKLKWGCLSVSSDTQTMLLTDVMTRNVHASADYGETWYQVFRSSTFKLQASVTVNACAVSADGSAFAVGFSGSPLRTSYNCDFSNNTVDEHCDWQEQSSASASGFFNTSGIALSLDGGLMFSTDMSTYEVSIGTLSP